MKPLRAGSPLSPPALFVGCLILFSLLFLACGPPTPVVTVYTSQDRVYSEPLLTAFTKETGIRTRVVYDSEAVKTVGLAQRLIRERAHPQCDVFWSNEELRTRQLAAQGLFRPTNGWAAVGYRSRRVVVNTNLLPEARAPQTLLELTNSVWRGKIALAYPLFGTTATHFLALRQHWGPEPWRAWCRALQANRPFLVDGNSVVVQKVARGEAWLGLTDSDDVAAGQREGWPVRPLPLSPEALLIPNTLAVIKDAPHPDAAQQLFAWLQQPEVVVELIAARALEGLSPAEITRPTLHPDWQGLLRGLEPGIAESKEIFLRR